MNDVSRRIREKARELFATGRIDAFLGYEPGSLPLRARPCLIQAGDEDRERRVGGLVWDSFCANNLAVFLPKLFEQDPGARGKAQAPKPRLGMVVKGCDLRSVTALVREKQAPRGNLLLIGVPCAGMVDTGAVEERLAGDEVLSASEGEGGKLLVRARDGRELTLFREEVLQACCRECRFPGPEAVDLLIEGPSRKPAEGVYERIRAFEARTAEERWEAFRREIGKCIRCGACRQACPTCYCKECFAEQTDPRWIGAGTELSDAMIFHLVRIFHQAGRCVECDACLRACPMGVDLRTFRGKIVKEVEELFHYLPGFSLEEAPPLSTFKEGDGEGFITEP